MRPQSHRHPERPRRNPCHPERPLPCSCHPERPQGVEGSAVVFRALILLLLISGITATSFAQPTRTDAEKDPVLKAMLTELDRSMASLQLLGFQKPFFIQYRIAEVSDFETRAAFGASQGTQRSHSRIARITVRVGDYKTDSSTPRGDGFFELAVLDDDPIALRSTLWNGTDQAYKSALAAYAQKQADLKQVQTPPQADDFSQEKPLIALATPLQLSLDEASWISRVAHDSGLYRTDPSVSSTQRDVQYSNAAFRARVTTTWLVSSEGAIVRKSSAIYQESFSVGTQATDGMHLDRSYASTGVTLADLDSPEAFRQQAIKLISSLTDLRNAPLVDEEYHGPVLLSSDAGADTLRSLLAAGVAATRPRLGTGARTNGPFASSLHGHILPDSFDVLDDPALKTYEGRDLDGAYDVDDEGVAAQPVKIVTEGRLDNYLIGRSPVRDFPESNGHGRAGAAGPARPFIGVLKVTDRNGLSENELTARLIALAKERGLKSAYFVSTLGAEATPRLLYRVDLDGTRQLVRGAVLDDLDQRALRRANEKNDKLPFYPPPD